MKKIFILTIIFSIIFISGCSIKDSVVNNKQINNSNNLTIDKNLPFELEKWEFIGDHKIEKYLWRDSLVLNPKGRGTAIFKDTLFKNWVIEYDVAFPDDKIDGDYNTNYPNGRMFAGINFRIKDWNNNESFYLRSHNSWKPDANQYTPDYNGMAGWQLYYGESYSASVEYPLDEWFHVKLVIKENLADIYIIDMDIPVLTVELKQLALEWKLALWSLNIWSQAHFSNFDFTKTDDVKIVWTPKLEKKAEKGTIMSYKVSNTFDEKLLKNKFQLSSTDKKDLIWTDVNTEKTGLVNLAQLQKSEKEKDTVFAKVNILSNTDQIKKLDFGFSNSVKVYLNNKLLFTGHDEFVTRDYRFLWTIWYYDSVYLDLNKWDNELIFAITEPPVMGWGWWIQSKIEDIENISFSNKK